MREAKVQKLLLRLVEKDGSFVGLVLGEGTRRQIEGANADEVWRRLHDEARKASPKYFGFDGARNRFLHFFPNGFRSPGYEESERNYKVRAKEILDGRAPVEAAAGGSGFAEAILAAYRATNLLASFESIRIQEVLRGPNADAFVQAAARFTLGEGKAALWEMERALKPHDSAKWTVVTYLPFLWRPQEHMYLKPEVTKEFAERVGHRFAGDYQSRLNIEAYESLLDLAANTAHELADLKPRDRIDVQSFIWVIGDYKEGEQLPAT